MAYEALKHDLTFLAEDDLSSYQYHFVKMSADNTVDICAAVTDKPIGVLQNKPDAAGKPALVTLFGVTKIVAASTIAYGELVGTDASGEADTKTPGTDVDEYYVGSCLIGGDVNEYLTVFINCAVPTRGTAT